MQIPERYVSYLRVSTAQQGRSGLGLEAQRKAIEDYLQQTGGELVAPEFLEVESGKKKERPILRDAIQHAKQNNAILLVAKLDRLARNLAFITQLQEAGVAFRACDMPEANEFMVHILGAVAQYERKMISERTKAGLAAAKARGVKLGRPENLVHGLDDPAAIWNSKQRVMALEAAERLRPVIKELQERGITGVRAICRALQEKGHKTARGGVWHPASVSRLLKRL